MTKDDLYEVLRKSLGRPPFPPMVDAVVDFVAEWLEGWGGYHREILPQEWAELAAKWREEMS